MGARTKKPSAPYIGRWHIVEMEQWDQEFIDLEGPGHITFAKGGKGSFHFGAVEGELDCRLKDSAEGRRVEFSWTGHDEMDPVTGRGWAVVKNGELHGHLYFHLGDDSWYNNPPAKPGVFRIAAPSKGADRNPTSKAHSEQAWAVVKRHCRGQVQILYV